MPLMGIKVKNFKSIENIDISLNKINILIGANGSGKSNFIDIFRFLNNIIYYGMENAISIQGGIEFLRNCNIKNSDNLEIGVELDLEKKASFDIGKPEKKYRINIHKIKYLLKLVDGDTRNKNSFSIHEILKIEYEANKIDFKQSKLNKEKDYFRSDNINLVSMGFGTLEFIKNPKLEYNISIPPKLDKQDEKYFNKELFTSFPFEEDDDTSYESLLRPVISIPYFISIVLDNIIRTYFSFDIFDFDPRLAKKGSRFTGKLILDEDGSNLPIVLKNIIKNEKINLEFNKKLNYILPFIDKIDVEDTIDKSTILKLNEKSFNNSLPAFLISDGTIHIVNLIIALFYNQSPNNGIIIEEPERNLHPKLISKVSELIKEASTKKQIIITTHNPEFLRNFSIDDILLVYRNDKGFSSILKPKDNGRIKRFLEDDIGIDKLYIDSLLEP